MASTCATCGHPLGVGRFCTDCGAPVDAPVADPSSTTDWRTDTAERRAERRTTTVAPREPRLPPAAVGPPPPARFPLFADEVADPVVDAPPLTPPAPAPADPPPIWAAPHEVLEPAHPPYAEPEPFEPDDRRRAAWPWVAVALVVVVAIGAGWWLYVRDTGSQDSGASPDAGGTGSSSASSGSADAGGDVARNATARAPRTAPPHQDVDGHAVSYDASNMLDGVPDTAWRMPGDGTGATLTFTLAEPTRLTEVGLVNGYAKTSTDAKGRRFDWYHGDRRVTAVVWLFDDGTKVRQTLEDDTAMQTVAVHPGVTKTVVLRLVTVSKVGTGVAARDDTAISEVSLVGSPT